MKPVDISLDELNHHFGSIQSVLSDATAPHCELKINVDSAVDPLVAGVVGAGCETAARTRGQPAPVAPMQELSSGLWAWLGYREEWNLLKKGGQTRHRFRGAGMTVHFGFKGIDPKPQIFRAEWAGIVAVGSKKFGFPAGDAGHPHWQFDAIESLLGSAAADRAQEFAAILKAEQEEAGIHDFTPNSVSGDEVTQVVCGTSIAAVHFPSVAPWWKAASENAHAHAPTSSKQVRDWVKGTLRYLGDELGRL